MCIAAGNCVDAQYNEYCNGPLTPGTYWVALRGILDEGAFSNAPFSRPIVIGGGGEDEASDDTEVQKLGE